MYQSEPYTRSSLLQYPTSAPVNHVFRTRKALYSAVLHLTQGSEWQNAQKETCFREYYLGNRYDATAPTSHIPMQIVSHIDIPVSWKVFIGYHFQLSTLAFSLPKSPPAASFTPHCKPQQYQCTAQENKLSKTCKLGFCLLPHLYCWCNQLVRHTSLSASGCQTGSKTSLAERGI